MAVVNLALTWDLADEQVFDIAKAAGLKKQSRLELLQCWDITRTWSDWIISNFGAVTAVRHRTPPDDPPDVELICEKQTVGMEHTRLKPPHLGQADALMRKSGQGGFIPSISSPPKNFKEMINIVSGVTPSWSSTMEDWKAVFDLLAITLRRKINGMPSGGIIAVVHDLVVATTNQRILAEVAQNIINRDEFADFVDYTLILMDRSNFRQYHSSLIRRGEDIRERNQI